MLDLKIGDVVYVDGEFDRKEQKSVYRKLTVTSEDDKRFIVADDGWINKRSGKVSLRNHTKTVKFYMSQEVWRTQWVVKNRHRVLDAVGSLSDYEKLHQIAKIAGYEPKVPEYIIKD